jgi:hypothetical protein
VTYLAWNDQIAKHFFNEEMAGREVLLYANKQIINTIGEGLGGVDEFIEAVKTGPPWVTRHRQGICQKALQAYDGWRQRSLDYPPYIAYLVLFVLAEDTQGDFAPHAYYPRLRHLLGEPEETGQYPSFDRMWQLWMDLEKWSREDKNEELGRFTFRIRGGFDHVGLPLSQTVLSHEERLNLPIIFSEAELDQTNIPADNVLRKILLYHGRQEHRLANRTLNLLEISDHESTELKSALIEFIINELAEWDGSVPESLQINRRDHRATRPGGLRICLNIDSVSNTVRSYLRFKSNRPIPDDGLNFQVPYDSKILSCYETCNNWSSVLKVNQSIPFDASLLDWSTSLKLRDTEKNWQATLKGANVRLFINGRREGLNDWIEYQRLERNCEFLVAALASVSETIENWGSQYCDEFQKKTYSGLPDGWTLFYGKNAKQSCEGIDVLTLPNILRMKLQGGIKRGRGNIFLKFGIPTIFLENISGNERVKINGLEIQQEDPDIPIWKLPANLPLNESLKIEVFCGGEEPIMTRIIKIEEPQFLAAFDEPPRRAPDGKIIYENSPDCYVTGAVVSSQTGETHFPEFFPTHLSSRIIFIGARPGEVADWPTEDIPSIWHPVWAIAKEGKRNWVVYFCGTSEHLEDSHKPGLPLQDSGDVKRWKKAIWKNRRLNKKPVIPKLLSIWQKYEAVARNA